MVQGKYECHKQEGQAPYLLIRIEQIVSRIAAYLSVFSGTRNFTYVQCHPAEENGRSTKALVGKLFTLEGSGLAPSVAW